MALGREFLLESQFITIVSTLGGYIVISRCL